MDTITRDKHLKNIETVYLHFMLKNDYLTAATIDFNNNNPNDSLHILLMRGPHAVKMAAMMAAQDVVDEFIKNPQEFENDENPFKKAEQELRKLID